MHLQLIYEYQTIFTLEIKKKHHKICHLLQTFILQQAHTYLLTFQDTSVRMPCNCLLPNLW